MLTLHRAALSLIVVTSIAYAPAASAEELRATELYSAQLKLADGWGMVPRPDGSRCPAINVLRTPEQVLADRLAAIEAGDIDAVMCTYAPDAIVVMPSGAMTDLATIRSAFEMMTLMLGGATPTITNVVISGPVVMTLFHFEGAMFSIPDGSDTYIIKFGHIQYHTAHNTAVFNPPPAP